MRNVVLVVGSLLLAACGVSESESQLGQAAYYCKIEGSAIGHEGFLLRLGPKAVRFRDWVEKAGSPNEYVGFSLSIAGATSVSYVVNAETQTFPSNAKTWLQPDASGISNIDLCGECEDGSCGGGGDGGGTTAGGGGDGDGECQCDPALENCSGPLL